MAEGFVYLVRRGDSDSHKIGFTRNEPRKRLMQLQTACDAPLSLIFKKYCENASLLEKMMQRSFSHKKKSGEWFDLSRDDVSDFKERCEKYSRAVKFTNENNTYVQNKKKR